VLPIEGGQLNRSLGSSNSATELRPHDVRMEEDGDFNEIFNALPTDHDAAADVRAKLVEWEKISSTDRTDTLEGKRASGVEIAFTEKSNALRMDSRLRNERRLAIGHVVRVGMLIVRKLAWRHAIAFDDQALPSKFDARQQRRW
jgi:hypothetical protein